MKKLIIIGFILMQISCFAQNKVALLVNDIANLDVNELAYKQFAEQNGINIEAIDAQQILSGFKTLDDYGLYFAVSINKPSNWLNKILMDDLRSQIECGKHLVFGESGSFIPEFLGIGQTKSYIWYKPLQPTSGYWIDSKDRNYFCFKNFTFWDKPIDVENPQPEQLWYYNNTNKDITGYYLDYIYNFPSIGPQHYLLEITPGWPNQNINYEICNLFQANCTKERKITEFTHMEIPQKNGSVIDVGESQLHLGLYSKLYKQWILNHFKLNYIRNKLYTIDIITNVGTENLYIPIKAKFNCLKTLAEKLSFTAKIRFNASTFYPTSLTKGTIIENTIDSNFFRNLTIQCDNVNISDTDSILTEIVGIVLLGDSLTPIEITDFKWNNSNIEIDTIINGSLKIIACRPFPFRILLFKPIVLQILPNPANDEIEINIEGDEEGSFTLCFYNLQGIIAAEKKWYHKKKEKENFQYSLRNIPTGFYQVVLKTPWNVISKPLMIVK